MSFSKLIFFEIPPNIVPFLSYRWILFCLLAENKLFLEKNRHAFWKKAKNWNICLKVAKKTSGKTSSTLASRWSCKLYTQTTTFEVATSAGLLMHIKEQAHSVMHLSWQVWAKLCIAEKQNKRVQRMENKLKTRHKQNITRRE